MNLLWFTWKDKKHPLAGGAELVNEELAKRLVKDGHKVIFIVGGFPRGKGEEKVDGYKIIRLGNKWTIYWLAYKYYKKNLASWANLVIDEVNTIPFFAKFYTKEKNILFIHQLCREIWFYQICFPLNLIGYILEPIYLRLLSDRKVVTVSESSKKDLMRFGFKQDNISIISEGTEIEPVKELKSCKVIKYKVPTMLSLGVLRSMKRTLHAVKAFEIAKGKIIDLKLVITGDANSNYGKKVLGYINNSKYKNSIKYLGKVSADKKVELLQKSHLIAVTSVKEGWGLIVTEANSQGTPAVVYNIDGLRDSVLDNQTGLITKENTPNGLTEKIVELMRDKKKYAKLQKAGWQWSKEINFENSYKNFKAIISTL